MANYTIETIYHNPYANTQKGDLRSYVAGKESFTGTLDEVKKAVTRKAYSCCSYNISHVALDESNVQVYEEFSQGD